MFNCAIIMLEGESSLTHPSLNGHIYLHTHMQTHTPLHTHMPMQLHRTRTCTCKHTHTHTLQYNSTRHKWFHGPPANGQCHLKLVPRVSFLCMHDVSHPCTCTHCIVRWDPTMSPTYAQLIYGYTSFGCGVPVTHTHPHTRYCAAGSTSVIPKMTIPWRRSPFMDDLVRSNPPPLDQDWQKDLFYVCVQTGGSCVIFTNLWMVAGQSGGLESCLKGQGNQYWWMS
ncbi:hypothetical protein O181_073107 [Austropuccinia psidii MF-1]|uniref:Uncharacterized protein n=1 Tax=Austropuccinia psidii MF-1 TaxID=1389203 RepID=A0A9Q3F8E5_9BASI|nr:hypothetical protein [Austropuccinia psidii MF-1]